MSIRTRLVAASWFAVASIVSASFVWLASGMHSSFSAQQQNFLSYAASGVIAAFIWGWILGKRVIHNSTALKAAFIGLAVAVLSLFTLGTVTAIGLAVLDLVQGHLAQAGERVLIAIPMGLALGFWALLLAGWSVLPVGAVAGVLLRRYRGKEKSNDCK